MNNRTSKEIAQLLQNLRRVPRTIALPPNEEGRSIMVGSLCHQAARVIERLSTPVETTASPEPRATLENIYRSLCVAWDNRTLPASVLTAEQFTRMREALDLPFPGYAKPGLPPEEPTEEQRR